MLLQNARDNLAPGKHKVTAEHGQNTIEKVGPLLCECSTCCKFNVTCYVGLQVKPSFNNRVISNIYVLN